MGLDYNGVKALLIAKRSGVSFKRVATIGRQALHLDIKLLQDVFKLFNINKDDLEIGSLLSKSSGYAEPLFKMLGAEKIFSIDVSAYEGASYLHDMNLPIDENLKNAFTVVIDGGSLEHIFYFPNAIRNCMEMVETGGHFLSMTPSNNSMGHGFYQFSPELFFRIFTRANGFKTERILAYESSYKKNWYEVIDPEKIQARVEIINFRPLYLFVQAKKLENLPIFLSNPQQSDYSALWNLHATSNKEFNDGPNHNNLITKKLYKALANTLVIKFIRKIVNYYFRFKPPYFKKFDINSTD